MAEQRYNYGSRRKMKKRTLAQNLNEQGGLGTSYNSSSPETKQSRQRSTPMPMKPGAMGQRQRPSGQRPMRQGMEGTAGFKRYMGPGSPTSPQSRESEREVRGRRPAPYGRYPNNSPRPNPAPPAARRYREGRYTAPWRREAYKRS